MVKTSAPRHKGLPILGSLLELYSDPQNFFQQLHKDYGDVVRFNMVNFDSIAIFDPKLIGEVLVSKHHDYSKNRIFWDNVKEVFGNGLLTNEGESWKTQRKLASPSFRPKSVATYIDSMISLSDLEVSSWINGSRIDIHDKMMGLTANIIAKIIFNTTTGDKGQTLLEALKELEHLILSRIKRPHPFIHKLPLPSNKRYQNLIDVIESEVMGFIDESKESDSEYPTLLSNLMRAKYEDGSSMSNKQLRDEIMTIFLAGHDTTAITLSSTFYLLSQHNEVERKMLREIDYVLNGEALTADKLDKLTYTKKVIKESMRLMPVVWAIGREAERDTQLGPYKIHKGTTVYICQYLMQRLDKYFESPKKFDPERWTDEFTANLPKYVYSPFGGGPRVCIGEHLSMLEAIIILVTVYRKFKLVYEEKAPPEYFAGAVLTPKRGMPMAVFRR